MFIGSLRAIERSADAPLLRWALKKLQSIKWHSSIIMAIDVHTFLVTSLNLWIRSNKIVFLFAQFRIPESACPLKRNISPAGCDLFGFILAKMTNHTALERGTVGRLEQQRSWTADQRRDWLEYTVNSVHPTLASYQCPHGPQIVSRPPSNHVNIIKHTEKLTVGINIFASKLLLC